MNIAIEEASGIKAPSRSKPILTKGIFTTTLQFPATTMFTRAMATGIATSQEFLRT
jgi:hypothetical protein